MAMPSWIPSSTAARPAMRISSTSAASRSISPAPSGSPTPTSTHGRPACSSTSARRPTPPPSSGRLPRSTSSAAAGRSIRGCGTSTDRSRTSCSARPGRPSPDVDAFPDQLDFAGPAGISFLRQPQIRYTHPLAKGQSLALGRREGHRAGATDHQHRELLYTCSGLRRPLSPRPRVRAHSAGLALSRARLPHRERTIARTSAMP